MKNKIIVCLAIVLLVLVLFRINLDVAPVVFSDQSVARREIWQIVNVTNTHGSMATMGDIKVALSSKEGVNIAWSTNITKYYRNESGSILGYNTSMEWLNGTSMLPYHWGEMDWHVSEGSNTSITWDEIKYWWDMYKDTGGGVSYTTFMGNTYMADYNLTYNEDEPDIIRYNQTHVGVPWIGNNMTIKDLVVPASTTIHLVLKIVITTPGAFTFNLSSANALLRIEPSSWRAGGSATTLVPDEYATIQAAVNASSSGDTIIAYDGVYDEQVVVNKSLIIQGMGDNTIIRPSSAAKLTQLFDGLFWYGTPNTMQIAGIIVANVPDGSNVTIKNLKVDESSVATSPGGYLAGIFYRETGGTVDAVTVVGGGSWSPSRAYGIYLSAATNTVSVQIKGSAISNYDKNGIEAMGNKLTVNVHHNTITGRGPTLSGDEVQNGVNVGRDAVVMVNYNKISNLEYQPQTWWAAAIMFYHYVSPTGKSGSAQGNNITNCQIGIIFKNANGSAQDNTVSGGTVGLVGIYSEPNYAGAYTASFVNNTVSGVSGYENAAIGANTYATLTPGTGATLTVTVRNNSLIGGSPSTADGVYVDGSAGNVTATISDNKISGWNHGINLASACVAGATITGNNIQNNTGADSGIFIKSDVNATNIRVNFNNIIGSNSSGIFNNGTDILDARFNWWGNETGPYNPTLNPSGLGDNVTDNVEFKPWLVQPYPPPVPVAQLYISPQLVQCWTGLNKTFTIKVKLDSVKLLYAFEFKLTWNPTLLNLTTASYASLWTDTYQLRHVWNNPTGEYQLALSGRGNVLAFTGNATLATLTFLITNETTYPNNVASILALVNTNLTRLIDPLVSESIPHIVYNGTYMCNYTLPQIMLVEPLYVVKRVPKDFDVNITVTYVVNLEAFNFTLTYDKDLLRLLYDESKILLGTSGGISWSNGNVSGYATGITPRLNGTATLAKLRFRALGVVWNTVNRSGSCALTFSYTNLTGPEGASIEHVAINGTYIYKPVPGDLNMDGVVGIEDLSAAARAFGARRGEPRWYEIADLNRDDIINIRDIVLIARNYLREEPEP